jgi:phenylpropionate dioxygenase-like ring-hydroxylating dioxygenase large terminal subunit
VIPHRNYFEPEFLSAELGRFFEAGWEFVGLTSELPYDRDFVTVEYQGCSVVVQNFKGDLRAFQNICTHRFTKLQWEDKGNRPLACRYHSWTYDSEGVPAIPRKNEYQVERPADICLPRYRLDTCGQFIFVNRSGDAAPLRKYLGDFWDVLENISRHLGAQIHYATVPHKANWKILVENVLDNYHCPILHKETFVSFGFCRSPVEDTVIDGAHSSWHSPRHELEREGLRRRALSHLADREFAHQSFYHIHLFPNLFVASTEGLNFYVGHALPISAEETLLRARYFEPNLELKPSHRMRQDMLNDQTGVYGLSVIEEDRVILETIQRGIRLSGRPGIIGGGEPRIRAFIEHYKRRMA